MKIRNSFVSNSSSSSFIIACKDEPTEQSLMKMFNQNPGDFFYPAAKSLTRFILDEIRSLDPNDEDLQYYCKTKHLKIIKDNNYNIYLGFASNQDEDVEQILCSMDVDYQGENLIFYKEANF